MGTICVLETLPSTHPAVGTSSTLGEQSDRDLQTEDRTMVLG